MKQILQKRRLTTISQDLRWAFLLLVLTSAVACCVLPAAALTAEDQAQIRDLVNRGNTLLNAARYKEALEDYEAVLQIDPQNHYGRANQVLAHNKWALSLFRAHKYKEARQHWDTAHQLNPNDSTVNQNLKVLEFHLKKLGITEEEEPKEADKSAPTAFDPLRENPCDWSPFKRAGQAPTGSAQVAKPPVQNNFNVGGGIPQTQQAQVTPPQPPTTGDAFSQSGPQLMGGVSGSPSVATSGPVILSGGTTSGVASSGPVILNGSASGGPAAVSSSTNGAEPGAVPNPGNSFSLSGGASNTDSGADFSGVKIVGGLAPSSQTVNEGHEGLPFTESSSPPPGTATTGGYGASAGSAYEAASHTASGSAIINSGTVGASGPAIVSAPAANYAANPPANYVANAPVANYANTPPANTYQQTINPPAITPQAYEPMGNVNMSFGTAGNVIIPPPSNRHGTGTAYKFPSNIVPPRAAPGFLGAGSPVDSAPDNSKRATSNNANTDSETDSYSNEEPEPPSKAAASGESDSAANVNKVLLEIEKKIYGKTSEHLPILKRLERIEIDTLGKKVAGSINDRLNKMKETYGL